MYKINKKYHFYAGHRNENLDDKCRNLHGHTYYVTMDFEFQYNEETGITFLFSNIDRIVEPIIKELDHSLLINSDDPLLQYLYDFMQDEGEDLKIYKLEDMVTSAEHLSKHIFERVEKHLPIKKITLQETTSSIVTYENSN